MTRKKPDPKQLLFDAAIKELGITIPVRKHEFLPGGGIKIYTRDGTQVYTPKEAEHATGAIKIEPKLTQAPKPAKRFPRKQSKRTSTKRPSATTTPEEEANGT